MPGQSLERSWRNASAQLVRQETEMVEQVFLGHMRFANQSRKIALILTVSYREKEPRR
jgi:hypothetical protein